MAASAGQATPNRRVIAREIADAYGRAVTTVQQQWMTSDLWPPVVGKRGRWHEYDFADVDAVVREHFLRDHQVGGNPDDLLTIAEISEYTGLAPATVRADISRGRIKRDPDDYADGVKRWKRSTIEAAMKGRRKYSRPPESATPTDIEIGVRITVPAAVFDNYQPLVGQLVELLGSFSERLREEGGSLEITTAGQDPS
ncbi:helix-turn-helix transcriptional regulator [Nocardia sp. NPDC058058]|uniref:helix-turn-helix transcriptional regulator n=1 Tax=Nocardia sp. NPDC058058 TaxID=3346317 RepID=UPI0036DC8743